MSNEKEQDSSEYGSIPLLPPSTFQTSLEKMNVYMDESPGQFNTEDITCTPKALEVLRNCHGQFIALLASELVLCEEEKHSKNIKTNKAEAAAEAKERVRTITPKDVTTGLQRLEFHDILSKLKQISNDTNTSNCESKSLEKGASSSEKKTSKRKRKGHFKNSSLSEEELAQEQDRLFALSAAKAKEKMTNK
jgi:ABC-type molybdate transport system substrate-binding protein